MTRSLFGSASADVDIASSDGTVKVEEKGKGRYDVTMNLDSALFRQTVNTQAISLNLDANSLQEDPTLGLQVKLKTPLSALGGVGLETNANQFVVDPTFNQLNLAVPAAVQQTGTNPNGTPLGNLAFKSAADWNTADVANKPTLGTLAAKNSVDYATADVTNKPAIGALAPLNVLDYLSAFLSNKPTLGALSPLNVLDYASALLTNKPALGALSPLNVLDYASTLLTNKPTLGTLAAKNAVDYATTDVANKPTLGALAPLNVLDYQSALLINKPVTSANTGPPYTWTKADGTTQTMLLDANGELTISDRVASGWAYPLRSFAATASVGNGVIWQYGVSGVANNCAQLIFNYAGSGSLSNSIGMCLNGPSQGLILDGNNVVSVANQVQCTGTGLGNPTFTTRSAGTRFVLWKSLGAATVDNAIGMADHTVWFSAADATNSFRWFLGTANVLTLQDPTGSTGSGCLVYPNVPAGPPSSTARSAGTKVVYYAGSVGEPDYAVGIESGCLWHSVPRPTALFRWYVGTTNVLTLQDPTGSSGGGCVVHNQVGTAAPSTGSRSAGTKVVYCSGNDATETDYATGVESGCLWHSVPIGANRFKWYHGSAMSMELSLDVGTFLKFPGDMSLTQTVGTGKLTLGFTNIAMLKPGVNFTGSVGKLNVQDPGNGYLVCWYSATNANLTAVTTSGSTVFYNTGSDYRVKENLVPIEDGLAKVEGMRPYRFNYTTDPGRQVQMGCLAHELATVAPEAVWGEKDAVAPDGTPLLQGVDYGKLVPLLISAVQTLSARVTALESLAPPGQA
jgi:hypothetical protein